jgi:hypothetical protein
MRELAPDSDLRHVSQSVSGRLGLDSGPTRAERGLQAPRVPGVTVGLRGLGSRGPWGRFRPNRPTNGGPFRSESVRLCASESRGARWGALRRARVEGPLVGGRGVEGERTGWAWAPAGVGRPALACRLLLLPPAITLEAGGVEAACFPTLKLSLAAGQSPSGPDPPARLNGAGCFAGPLRIGLLCLCLSESVSVSVSFSLPSPPPRATHLSL